MNKKLCDRCGKEMPMGLGRHTRLQPENGVTLTVLVKYKKAGYSEPQVGDTCEKCTQELLVMAVTSSQNA